MFATIWNLAGSGIKQTRRYRASVTVEAAFVLGVLMFCISGFIGYAYKLHDRVTGTMILEEVLIQERRADYEGMIPEKSELEAYGEALGNPRLWLDTYKLETQKGANTVAGKATAGSWSQEMELELFQPAEFLRKNAAWNEQKKEWNNDGSGIQTGDEPELHGDSTGDGWE